MKGLSQGFCLWVVAGFAVSAPAQFSRPSAKTQVKLGLEAATEIRKKEKILPDSDIRVKTLRRIGQRLLNTIEVSKPEGWQYSFDVIESKDLNAFALPGGPVFFYTGILEKMRSEDELAGVLAHEIGHVRREHWARMAQESQNRNLGLTAILILGRAGRDVTNVVSLANDIYSLKYSRRYETESDDHGYDMMTKAGFNPRGLVDLFTMLREQSKGGKPPEFLSTHPDDKNRIKRIEDKIKKDSRTFPAMTPMTLPRAADPKKDVKKDPPEDPGHK